MMTPKVFACARCGNTQSDWGKCCQCGAVGIFQYISKEDQLRLAEDYQLELEKEEMIQGSPPTRKSRLVKFKFKVLETVIASDGKKTSRVMAFPPYGIGYSKYPVAMFVRGENAVAVNSELANISPGKEITLSVYPATVKATKPDDGTFGNYFWNVDGIGEKDTIQIKAQSTSIQTPAQSTPTLPRRHQTTPDPTRISIERQTALKAAVELATASALTVATKDILNMAAAFFNWLQEDTTVATPSEAPEAPQKV